MAFGLVRNGFSLPHRLTGGVLLATCLGIVACSDGTDVNSDVVEATPDIEEVAEDGDATLVGERTALRGSFDQAVDESAFELREETLFPDDAVLVINVSGADYTLPGDEETELWVVGTIVMFERAAVSEQYDLVFDSEVYDEYEGRTVILADYIALAPDPETLVDDSDAFYGQRVFVDGEIEQVLAPDAFTMDNEDAFGDKGLLVVGAAPDLTEENPVAISGIMMPFSIATLEADYELVWDAELKQTLEQNYDGRPTLVSDELYPFSK